MPGMTIDNGTPSTCPEPQFPERLIETKKLFFSIVDDLSGPRYFLRIFSCAIASNGVEVLVMAASGPVRNRDNRI